MSMADGGSPDHLRKQSGRFDAIGREGDAGMTIRSNRFVVAIDVVDLGQVLRDQAGSDAIPGNQRERTGEYSRAVPDSGTRRSSAAAGDGMG